MQFELQKGTKWKYSKQSLAITSIPAMNAPSMKKTGLFIVHQGQIVLKYYHFLNAFMA
jgi:hypothetical protein